MSVDSKDVLAPGWHIAVDAAAIVVAGAVVAASGGLVWPQAALVGMAVGAGMVLSRPGSEASLGASSGRSPATVRVQQTHGTLRCGLAGGVVGVVFASLLGAPLRPLGVLVAVVVPALVLGISRTVLRWFTTQDRPVSSGSPMASWSGWVLGKRVIDIVGSAFLLVALLPFVLLSWLTTPRAEWPRWTETSGRFGRPFALPTAALPHPTRRQGLLVLWYRSVTVVRGLMSLVGPRPAPRTDVGVADAVSAPDGSGDHALRPGLTGVWALGEGPGEQVSTPLHDVAVLLQVGLHSVRRGGGAHGGAASGWTVRSTDGKVRVLHVVESLAAGVATALESYVRLTPEFEHVIIGHRREGSQIGDGLDELCRVVDLPTGPLAARRAVRSEVRRVRPDIVHAHSSLAGVYVRTLRGIETGQIVYSPHCYAFERQDVSRVTRGAFRVVERGLARRTGTVAAVGEHEARLATRLRRTARTVVVPHVPDLPEPSGTRATASFANRPLTVAALGRIQPQKGIDFLIQAAGLTARDTRWRWIGGGDAEDEALLRDAGVDVIGWVPRAQALAELADADVYVHTAQWEGMPLTVLEAAGLGLPVVARRIAPLDRIGLPRLADTPDAMAAHIDALQDEECRRSTATEVQSLIARYTRERQREALLEAYQVDGLARLGPPTQPLAERV